MAWFFYAYWWLIFPIMGFLFGGFGMWMNYRAHRDRMDLMRTYAAQGKDPAEIARILQIDAATRPDPWNDPTGASWGMGPGWRYGRWGYWGPMREWRRFIVFLCLAVGFGVASRYADLPGTEHAFVLVAIIMGVLAFGSLVFAVLSTMMMTGQRRHDP
jgi:hypothetical protein